MMISGAAYSSDPQRVVSIGCAGSMKRERPKSVSLSRGVVRGGTGFAKGLDVKRMSTKRSVQSRKVPSRALTFEFNVPMH